MRRCNPTASRHGSPPSSRTVPPSARSRPSSIRMVVDFPAPLGPRKPVMSPGATVMSRASSALVRPRDLDSPRISTASCDRVVLARCRDAAVIVLSFIGCERNTFFTCLEECVVHGRVGHQALGVELEGGQHHLLAVVAEDCAQISWRVVHLDEQEESAAAGEAQELGTGARIAARLEQTVSYTFFEILFGVVDH